jgi:hypothetical protein
MHTALILLYFWEERDGGMHPSDYLGIYSVDEESFVNKYVYNLTLKIHLKLYGHGDKCSLCNRTYGDLKVNGREKPTTCYR